MTDEPEKKKGFFKRIRDAFNGVSRRDALGVLKETLQDLTKPKEIALLVGCSFVPGGWIGYGVYRVAKYRHGRNANDKPADHKPANDNNGAPPGRKKKPPAPPRP